MEDLKYPTSELWGMGWGGGGFVSRGREGL